MELIIAASIEEKI